MNRTQSAIRTMWGWAAKRDYIPIETSLRHLPDPLCG